MTTRSTLGIIIAPWSVGMASGAAVASGIAVVLPVSVEVVAAVVDEDVVVVVDEVAVPPSPSSSPPQAASIASANVSTKSTAKGRVTSIARLEFFNLVLLLAFPYQRLAGGHIPLTTRFDIAVYGRYFFTALIRSKWLHRPATLPGQRQLSTTSGFSMICGGM